MPELRLDKERLCPEFPFPHRRVIGVGLVMRPHAIEVVFVDAPLDASALRARGALGFDWAGITRSTICLLDDLAFRVLGGFAPQSLPIRPAVGVGLRVIGEARGTEVLGALVPIRQRRIHRDPGILDGDDVLDRPVGRVRGNLMRPEVPAEAGLPEEIEHHLVLHRLAWRDQHLEDDAGSTTIGQVVVVIAQLQGSSRPGAHRGCIRIGGTHLEVGDMAIASVLDIPLLLPALCDPVVATGILLRKIRRRIDREATWLDLLGRLFPVPLGVGVLSCTRLGGIVSFLFLEEGAEVFIDCEARLHRVEGGNGLHFGGVDIELLAPDQPCLHALLDNRVEEPEKRPRARPVPGCA